MVIGAGIHIGGGHGEGMQVGGAHTGAGQLGGAQTIGAQLGGAHLFGAGGASRPPMMADGMPITAPQMLVHAFNNPPHSANGPPVGPHDGGAQLGGAQLGGTHVGGAHTGGGTIGGPPAIPTDGLPVISIRDKIERTATNLSAIPHPPFFSDPS